MKNSIYFIRNDEGIGKYILFYPLPPSHGPNLKANKESNRNKSLETSSATVEYLKLRFTGFGKAYVIHDQYLPYIGNGMCMCKREREENR